MAESMLLKLKSRGPKVKQLTNILVKRKFLDKPTATFSRTVKVAVEEFQSRHIDPRGRPLKVDGIVGELTWWALTHPDNTKLLSQPYSSEFLRVPRTGGSKIGRAALRVAIKEMKKGAKEIGSNNSGPWVKKYINGQVDLPANWCAGFVSWCFSQTSGGIPFKYSLGARNIRSQFKKKGWTYDVGGQLPEPGDIIVWWRRQRDDWRGHIGFVHHSQDGILYTIEGNKGGFPAPVRPFDYVLSRIDKLLGFGRVP